MGQKINFCIDQTTILKTILLSNLYTETTHLPVMLFVSCSKRFGRSTTKFTHFTGKITAINENENKMKAKAKTKE